MLDLLNGLFTVKELFATVLVDESALKLKKVPTINAQGSFGVYNDALELVGLALVTHSLA